jgi:hypothetical protein
MGENTPIQLLARAARDWRGALERIKISDVSRR